MEEAPCLPPKLIFDSKNTLLVENNIQQDLEINPSFIENPRIFLKQIADLLELNLNKIESDFYIRATGKSPNEPYILIKDLNEKQIAKLSVNLKKIKGAEIISSFSRNVILSVKLKYPHTPSATAMISDIKFLNGICNSEFSFSFMTLVQEQVY